MSSIPQGCTHPATVNKQHMTRLYKLVHPWEGVSEVQSVNSIRLELCNGVPRVQAGYGSQPYRFQRNAASGTCIQYVYQAFAGKLTLC